MPTAGNGSLQSNTVAWALGVCGCGRDRLFGGGATGCQNHEGHEEHEEHEGHEGHEGHEEHEEHEDGDTWWS